MIYQLDHRRRRQTLVYFGEPQDLGDFSRIAASARLLEPIPVVHQALGRVARPRRFIEPLVGHGGLRVVSRQLVAIN